MCIRQKEGDFFMRTAIPANEQITYKKGVIPVLRALLFGYILSFVVAWLINNFKEKTRSLFTFFVYSPVLGGNIYFIWTYNPIKGEFCR